MRHRVYGKHLGRNKDERRNLFKGLVRSLFSYGTIQTSEVKAKAIKGLVDKIINAAKDKDTGTKFQSYISDKHFQERLTGDIIPKMGNRTSGFTSTMKLGTRSGDQTMMVRMSLIGAEELKPIEKELNLKNQESSKQQEKPTKKISEEKGNAGRSVRLTKSTRKASSKSFKIK